MAQLPNVEWLTNQSLSTIPVTFIPDNVIGPRDAPWLIVDAKYKNPLRESWGREYFHNEDLYQAFTYSAALDAPAVLVYPRVDRDVDVRLGCAKRDGCLTAVDLLQPIGTQLGLRRSVASWLEVESCQF